MNMSSTCNSGEADRLLGPAADHTVPLVVLTDDTQFGTAVGTAFGRACPSELRTILLRGGLPDLPALLQQRFDYRFRARVLPLVLWEHEPTWVVWYFNYSREKLALIRQAMAEVPPELAGEIRWFLFVHFESKEDWAAAKDELLALPVEAGFVLRQHGLSVRPPASLGAGAALFSLAAWSRFRNHGDGNIATAWLLPRHEAPWFTLGVAMDGPDLEFHREAGAALLALNVLEAWQRPGAQPERPFLPEPSVILQQLLPQEYLCEPSGADHETEHRLLFTSTTHRLRYAARPPQEPSVANTSREILLDWLMEVQRFHQWLRLIAEPPALAGMSESASSYLPRLAAAVRAQVRLGAVPEGALDSLGKRLADCAGYASDLLSARSQPARTRQSLAQAVAKAERQIAVIPNWQAGLLRFGLVAVGLIWLCIGSMVWPGQPGSSFPDGTGWVSFCSAVFLVLLLAAVLGQWWYWRIRAWRAVERVRQLIVADHLARIGAAVTSHVCNLGQAVRERLRPWQKALTAMQNELRDQPLPPASRANDNLRFTDKALKTLLGERLDALAQAVQRAVRDELHHHGDWPQFAAANWLALLRAQSLAQVTPLLEQLTYDDWVHAQGLAMDERVQLLGNLVLEARRPAWCLRPGASAVLCLARAGDWQGCSGRHDELEFHNLDWREILAVSPMSLPEGV